MRVLAHSAIVAAAVMLSGSLSAQSKDPAAILAAARQALGGEAKIAAVKSFTATGRTRQVRGDNLVPIEFELFVELPDRYLRKDEVPAQESGPSATGFNGTEFLQDPPPPVPPAPPGGAAPNPVMLEAAKLARVNTVKQDFARLVLGMFATSYPSYPLTFTYVGEAEAPQGKADVIDGKGPNNFTLRIFVHQQTHLPIMVSWQAPAAGRGRPGGPGPGAVPPGARGAGPDAGRGAPAGAERGAAPPAGQGGAAPAVGPVGPLGPGGAPPAAAERGAPPAAGAAPPAGPGGAAPQAGERGAPGGAAPAGERGAPPAGGRPGGPPAAPTVENRLYFADYREVDGLQLPFRLRRAVGPDTTEETTFDRFRLNAKIEARRFEVRK